jgi:hypothetical protein
LRYESCDLVAASAHARADGIQSDARAACAAPDAEDVCLQEFVASDSLA